MPRKTRYEIEAEASVPEPDTLAYWQKEKIREQALSARAQTEHRQILIAKARGELLPLPEVRELFSRVFAAYRQAGREIDRRYGPEAAAILTQAERSALRAQQEDSRLCQEKKRSTRSSGRASSAKPKRPARSASSPKRKS